MKCDNCLNARRIISENGLHSICCLSEKVAMECIMGKKDHRVPRIMVEPQERSGEE
jgi:hypothetical protein